MNSPMFSKKGKQILKLERSMQRQAEIATQMAAAFVADGRPVPPELGEFIGVLEVRRREFARIRDIYIEERGGPGVKTFVEKVLKRIQALDIEDVFARLSACLPGSKI